jgi:putative intracellular protease/amidase
MNKLFRIVAAALLGVLSLHGAWAASSKGKVLVVLSSQTELPLKSGKLHTTGFYMNEFGVPADALLKAGYTLVIATPKGNVPKADPGSLDTRYFGGDAQEMKRIEGVVAKLVRHPVSLDKVLAGDMTQYAGVFIPGGHAPLIDLANNPKLGQVLRYFHQAGKTTAAICHGPIALLAAQDDPRGFEAGMIAGKPVPAKNWAYAGYRMTIFSTPEEKGFEASLKGDAMRYYPSDAMTAAGADDITAKEWSSHVEVDRELITGQNPFSDAELAKTLIAHLDQQVGAAGH